MRLEEEKQKSQTRTSVPEVLLNTRLLQQSVQQAAKQQAQLRRSCTEGSSKLASQRKQAWSVDMSFTSNSSKSATYSGFPMSQLLFVFRSL